MDNEARQSLIEVRAAEIAELGSWRKIKKRAEAVGIDDVMEGYDKWADMNYVIAEAELIAEEAIEAAEVPAEPVEPEVTIPDEVSPEDFPEQRDEDQDLAVAVGGDIPVEEEPKGEKKIGKHIWLTEVPHKSQSLREFAETNSLNYCSTCQRPYAQDFRGNPVCPLVKEDCPRNGA